MACALSISGWVPDHAGKAVVVCLHPAGPALFIEFDDRAAAEAFDAELSAPCSRGCLSRHAIASTEPGRVRVTRGVYDAPARCPSMRS